MVMWIGADWDAEKCVVAFEDAGRVVSVAVKRHPDAVRDFLSGLGEQRVVVGIEAGDRLWAELWRGAGAEVHVFDGKKARRFAESLCSSGARDDRRSAEDLRSMVQSEAHRRDANVELPPSARGLDRLLRLSEDAGKELVRCENRLSSLLCQVHPALIAASKRSLRTGWGLRALELAPTPADWNALSPAAQAKALKGASKSKRAKLTKALGERWAYVDEAELCAIRMAVRHHVQAMREALARAQAVEKALEEAIAESPTGNAVQAIKGIGSSLATAIALGLSGGDGTQRDQLALSLGAAPVTMRSGTRGDARPGVRMRRAVAPMMQRASYLLGWQLVGHHRWAKAQYAACRAKGMSAAAAYRRITRSFSRVLTALIRQNTAFDEDRYIAALKQKGVAWAQTL